MNEKTWLVNIVIDEHQSEDAGIQMRARALLRASDRTTFVGVGLARRNPLHTDVPKVSEDMATARALADLSHQLYEAAAEQEGVTRSVLHSARVADLHRPRSSG
ncbi:dsRBD fold-containing protein [Rhodococcus sp. NPDC127530]|uniref:dsRBD fold-containing protein n=1 Tax=unclassified Rhodococcus (in: high G+C Gram-positive bacteria) TaxID=192944 RepID=UPI003632B7E3